MPLCRCAGVWPDLTPFLWSIIGAVSTLSILIVTYNSADQVSACLDALLAGPAPSPEIVVVDNASTDGSVARVQAHGERVRLVASPVNRGFAGGMNLAARQASGDVLALLNPDARVEVGWGAALLAAFDDPSVGVVGSKGLYPDGRIQHMGGRINPANAYATHIGEGEPDEGQYDNLRDVDFVSGFALATRRSTWTALGGLCEEFFPAYYEEIDYCYRARRHGQRVIMAPDARVNHDQHVQSGAISWGRAYIQRQRWLFALRHFDVSGLSRLLENEHASLPGWFGDREHGPAALRAYADLLGLWPRVCVARVDDPTLGGPVTADQQNAVQLGLLAQFREFMSLFDQDTLKSMRMILERLGTLPLPDNSPLLRGGGLHSRLARWLVGPYIDASTAFWYDYLTRQHAILEDLAQLVTALAPMVGLSQVWDDRLAPATTPTKDE